MNRRHTFILGLVGFFLLWGLFGFLAGAPRRELTLQETPAALQSILSSAESTLPSQVPVTGEAEPLWMEVVVFYGLIGLAALFLVFGLLSFANSTGATQSSGNVHTAEEKQEDNPS
jgi:hypothetical protein